MLLLPCARTRAGAPQICVEDRQGPGPPPSPAPQTPYSALHCLCRHENHPNPSTRAPAGGLAPSGAELVAEDRGEDGKYHRLWVGLPPVPLQTPVPAGNSAPIRPSCTLSAPDSKFDGWDATTSASLGSRRLQGKMRGFWRGGRAMRGSRRPNPPGHAPSRGRQGPSSRPTPAAPPSTVDGRPPLTTPPPNPSGDAPVGRQAPPLRRPPCPNGWCGCSCPGQSHPSPASPAPRTPARRIPGWGRATSAWMSHGPHRCRRTRQRVRRTCPATTTRCRQPPRSSSSSSSLRPETRCGC